MEFEVKLIIISPLYNFYKVRTSKSLVHGLFPKIIFISGNIFTRQELLIKRKLRLVFLSWCLDFSCDFYGRR